MAIVNKNGGVKLGELIKLYLPSEYGDIFSHKYVDN